MTLCAAEDTIYLGNRTLLDVGDCNSASDLHLTPLSKRDGDLQSGWPRLVTPRVVGVEAQFSGVLSVRLCNASCLSLLG